MPFPLLETIKKRFLGTEERPTWLRYFPEELEKTTAKVKTIGQRLGIIPESPEEALTMGYIPIPTQKGYGYVSPFLPLGFKELRMFPTTRAFLRGGGLWPRRIKMTFSTSPKTIVRDLRLNISPTSIPPLKGYFAPRGGGWVRIGIDKSLPAEEQMRVALHEIGHGIFKKMPSSLKNQWAKLVKQPLISSGSSIIRKSPANEEFADEFRGLLIYTKPLGPFDPKIHYKKISEILKKAIKHKKVQKFLGKDFLELLKMKL